MVGGRRPCAPRHNSKTCLFVVGGADAATAAARIASASAAFIVVTVRTAKLFVSVKATKNNKKSVVCVATAERFTKQK